MIRAFAFVTAVSFKNRMLLRVRRLRNPRYLVSTLAGLAYLWFVFFRRMSARGHVQIGGGLPTQMLTVGVDVTSLVILVIMIFAWALPGDSGGVEFSEAEIQFLFPAPLTRRQLLSYKIFRAQPPLLISALAMTLLGFRQGKFVGVWLSFVALSIYFTMTALGRARLRLAGIGFVTRLVVVLGTLLLLSWYVTSRFDRQSLSAELKQMQRSRAAASVDFHSPLESGGLPVILFVPRQMAKAILPTSSAALATSAAAVAAFGALFFLIASRLNVSFEEASLAEAQQKSDRTDRRMLRRAGTYVAFPRMPPPFQLRPGVRPEIAIFWKNLTASLRISSALLVIVGGCVILALAELFTTSSPSAHMTVIFIALCFCAVFPLMGAGVFAQDLRLDLSRIELLKSYPLRGEQLVAAEIAGPLLIVSAVELLLLAMTAVLLQVFGAPKGMAFAAQPEFIVIALLFAVPVCAAQLLLRNAFVVLFPAWVVRSKEEVKGFAVTGQRLLVGIANLILLGVVLLPAALILGPAYLIGQHYVQGPALLAIATVPAAALVAGEVLLGIRLLGSYFDGADLANEAGEVRA